MEPSIPASPYIPFHSQTSSFLQNYIVFFLLSAPAMKNCTKYFFQLFQPVNHSTTDNDSNLIATDISEKISHPQNQTEAEIL